jgi:hypothetical protein
VHHLRVRWTDGSGSSGERALTLVLRNVTSDDDDADGFTEEEETTAGTNPFSSNSYLAVNEVSRAGNLVTLSWSSVIGKQYRVRFSTDLSSWTDVTGTLVTATTATTSSTFTATSGELQFYQVMVVTP